MEATISLAEYATKLAERDARINVLEHQIRQLIKLVNGSKSERFVPTTPAAQLDLGFGEPATGEGSGSVTEQISYTRTKPRKDHPGRNPLPDHLPVEEVVLEPVEDTTGLKEIGREVLDTLDYIPGRLLIRRYIRPRYVIDPKAEVLLELPGGAEVIIASLPDRPLPKCIAEAGLLAQLCIAKYVDHLPFYRQLQGFQRDFGWTVSASTVGGWFKEACALLEPLYVALLRNVLETDYLQCDETTFKVLDHRDKRGKTHLGYLWVLRNPLTGNALRFTYRRGRGQSILQETLADFRGKLQTDGYSAYTSYVNKRGGEVELVSCLAHIRRGFYEAQTNDPERAKYALRKIQLLYKLEDLARRDQYSVRERWRMRRVLAAPIYYHLLEWVKEEQQNNLRSGAMGQALLYARNHLPRLEPYLEDGRVEMDNNLIENKIRPVALGRKNYLFAGSHQGAQRAAMMYSFFGTCKALDVNPREWLVDVLQRIGTHPIKRIDELLPAQWAQAQAAAKEEE